MIAGELLDRIGKSGNIIHNVQQFAVNIPSSTTFHWVLKIVLYVGLLIIGGVLFWKFVYQYKISARVKVKVAGKVVEVIDDRCKDVIDEQGKRKLEFFKLRKTTPVPQLRYRYFKKGMFRTRQTYEFELHDNGELYPIDLVDVDPTTKKMIEQVSIPEDRVGWRFQESKLLEKKLERQTVWDKYKQEIIVFSSMVVAFLICYFAFKEVGGGLKSIAGGMQDVARACLGGG